MKIEGNFFPTSNTTQLYLYMQLNFSVFVQLFYFLSPNVLFTGLFYFNFCFNIFFKCSLSKLYPVPRKITMFFSNNISFPERRNKRKSVLEITKMYYFKI